MSYRADREAQVVKLEETIERAEAALAEGHSMGAIALVTVTLARSTVLDDRRSYDRDRDRDRKFAAELRHLAGPEGSALAPAERTARLLLLARWLDEGYDNPPDPEDYRDEIPR